MVALFGPFSRPKIGQHHRTHLSTHHRPAPATVDLTAEARAMSRPGVRIV